MIINFADELSEGIKRAVESALRDTISMVDARWRQEARLKLNSTYEDYVSGLNSYVEVGNDRITGGVTLSGDLPYALEKGYPGFDMKPGFSRSKNVKRGKNGNWYVSIPLSDNTTKSPTPVTQPRDRYGISSKRTTWNRTGGTAGGVNKMALARMIKNDIANSPFKTISSNSPSDSWMHPGYEGVHLHEYMEQFAKTTFNTILTNRLKQL